MKFLEDEKLAQLTAELTDAAIGTGERKINGRIEAFTMKRAGTDKKYAHALGERFQHEIQLAESEIAQFQKSARSGRSQSIGSVLDKRLLPPSTNKSASSPDKGESNRRRRSNSLGLYPVKGGGVLKNPSRNRSSSFDVKGPAISPYSRSPLGDFHNSCTRRLMTDLILTLNASFPDYDFSNVRPSHFARVPTSSAAMNRTNEKLSEFAATTPLAESFLSKLWNAIDDVIKLTDSEVYSYVPPNRDDDDDPLGFLTQTLDNEDTTKKVPLWSFNFFFVNKSLKRIVLFTCVQTMCNEVVTPQTKDYDYNYNVANKDYWYNDITSEHATNIYTESSVTGGGYTDGNVSSCNEDDGTIDDFDMDADGMGQAAPPLTTVAN